MKTLKKINLKGISETLSEKELKNVLGGGGDGEITCFKCGNGSASGYYNNTQTSMSSALEALADYCPGGWISWTADVNGPSCF